MESTKSRQASARMEHRRSPSLTEKDTPNMEAVLQAISDIQSIDIDKLRTYVLQSSKPVGENVMDDLMQKTKHTLESQKRETHIVRKCLQNEQEFKKEYVKAFGETKINDLHKMMEYLNGFIEKLQTETDELRAKNEHLEEEKRVALEEKAKACRSLSRQMEDRLTYSNPNIADLSDQNRCSKLGERYTDLYENQWKDAFEILTETNKQNEENVIEILLKLLIECHNFAKMRAKQQMNDLVKCISGDSTMEVGDEIIRHLKEARKLADVRCADLLFQECERHIKENMRFARLYLKEKEMKLYLIECFQLCWLMAIQDPPVVLGKEVKYADDLDLTFYRHYTRTRNMINFVVLPPLFLYIGGPMLTKGVAKASQLKRDKVTTSRKKENTNAWDGRDRTGHREQPRGNTDEQDLLSPVLSSTRDIDDPMLWMKTHYPLTPESSMSTFASTPVTRFHPTYEQEPIIISTRFGYEVHPIETSYSHANVNWNKHEHINSTLGNGRKGLITGDVLNSSQRTRSRYGIEKGSQNDSESTTVTSTFRTRGTSHDYEPLQTYELPQFRNFKTKLGLHGLEFTKSCYPKQFDRFYAIYLEELQSKYEYDSYASYT